MSKTYDQAKIAFQKLSPKEGDVVAVMFPADIAHEQMALVAQMLQPLTEETGCSIVCLREGIQLHQIPEEKMNELGWFRKVH